MSNYVLNPYSIEGNNNSNQSALNTLIFRAPLGSDLTTIFTATSSISSSHPAIQSYPVTSSFYNNTSTYGFNGGPTLYTFLPNTEIVAQDSFTSGVKNRVSNKINTQNIILPLTSSQSNIPDPNVLSPFTSIQQNYPVSNSFTTNLDYLEVAFSPQNEINDDIVAQLGYFNIGDYIGDPTQLSQSLDYYPDLNALRDNYFKKYTLGNKSNYNLFDYIRLIKYFDNSLFKMIKDFTPARTDLASGIVIKQHMLERNRYKLPPAYAEQPEYTGSVQSQAKGYYSGYSSSLTYPSPIELFSGGTGGTMFDLTSSYEFRNSRNPIVGLIQSWSESIVTPSGSTIVIHNTLDEFFNGEFSGSRVVVTEQSLLDPDCEQYLHPDLSNMSWGPILYKAYTGSYSADVFTGQINSSSNFSIVTDETSYLKSTNVPQPGSMSLWWDPGSGPYAYRTPGVGGYNLGYTTQGIKYIKINKIDASGTDQSSRLRQATNIRINYSDIGPKDYPVIGIKKYSDHFVYTIPNYTNYVSTTDNEILNYAVSASRTGSFTYYASTPDYSTQILNYNNAPINISNRFNTVSGSYFLSNIPNINLAISVSFSYTSSGPSIDQSGLTVILRKYADSALNLQSSNFIIDSKVWNGGSSGSFSCSALVSGSFLGDINSYYGLVFDNGGQGVSFALDSTISNIQLKITQSQTPQAITSDLLIISPQVSDSNFENSDCNAVYGNETEYALSQYIEEADYNSGITIPTNYNLIIQGVAAKSTAKDYYYNLKRQTVPRYEGSRSTAPNINTAATVYYGTTSGSRLSGRKLSGSAIPSANIERYSQYFAVFNTVDPTLINSDFNYYDNSINLDIAYLINSNGDLMTVDNNSINLDRLFKPQEASKVILFNYGSDGQSVFTPTINEVGKRYQFIFELNNGATNKFSLNDQIIPITINYNWASSGTPVLTQQSTDVFKFTVGDGSYYIGKYFVNPTYSLDYGNPVNETSFQFSPTGNGLKFYYKPSQNRILPNDITSGVGTGDIYPFKSTFLPLVPGDKIKITDLNSGFSTFTTTIVNINNTSSTSTTTDIYITASSTPSSNFTNTNNIKISAFYRPYDSLTIINVDKFTNNTFNGLGIILPNDYNPTLDYVALLKKAGLL